MLLAVDIGNTNIVMGLFDAEKMTHHWRVQSNRSRTVDDYGHQVCYMIDRAVGCGKVDGVVIGSVVPNLTYVFEKLSHRYFELDPYLVHGRSDLGLIYEVESPHELIGADRIANTLAVKERYAENCLVVDMGTATTFDLVTGDGRYLGGVIAPGIITGAESLVKKAAMLHRVEIETPKSVICKNTETMMQSGIVFGAVGQIDGLVEKIKEEWGVPCKVIATGGFVNMLAHYSRQFDIVDPNLTLDGLRIAYQKLSKKNK
ncbi:type III pantothenate kinase [Gemmatimonadota bacterium]